jgi:hypothetical protein
MNELIAFWTGIGVTLVGLGIFLVCLSFVMRKRTIIKTHPILSTPNDGKIFETAEEVRNDCKGHSEGG